VRRFKEDGGMGSSAVVVKKTLPLAALAGMKPAKVKRSAGRPLAERAAMTLLAPGSGLTRISAACARRVSNAQQRRRPLDTQHRSHRTAARSGVTPNPFLRLRGKGMR